MVYPNDFYELDFLDVETAGSGDAITIRAAVNGVQTISVVDGGYADCGDKILAHIKKHYDGATAINHMVLTHPDGDHAAGLKSVLENFTVERLWMNRPWLYVNELLPYYPTYNDPQRLESRLKKQYPHVRDLEEIALARGVVIEDAFQGSRIGHFWIMSPSRQKFIELVLRNDDKAENVTETVSERLTKAWILEAATKVWKFVASAWGEENLPERETTPRNEMSVVQFAQIGGDKILLTGDVGVEGLKATIGYAPLVGLPLPGIDKFQVPHHGSRRNVSSDVLNELLGAVGAQGQAPKFTAVVSAAKADTHHPKKAVVRAMIHRGATTISTETGDKRVGWNAPDRAGWGPATPLEYPTEQED